MSTAMDPGDHVIAGFATGSHRESGLQPPVLSRAAFLELFGDPEQPLHSASTSPLESPDGPAIQGAQVAVNETPAKEVDVEFGDNLEPGAGALADARWIEESPPRDGAALDDEEPEADEDLARAERDAAAAIGVTSELTDPAEIIEAIPPAASVDDILRDALGMPDSWHGSIIDDDFDLPVLPALAGTFGKPTGVEPPPSEEAAGVSWEVVTFKAARLMLMELGALDRRSLELVAEIFQCHGFSATKHHLRHLIRRGTDIEDIHRAWQLRRAWLDSDGLHATSAQEQRYTLHGPSRLSWIQAVLVVEHFHQADSTDMLVSMLEAEKDHWQSVDELFGGYPSFKDYLFRHLLSAVDTRHELGSMRNLDPSNPLTFDGAKHGHCNDWWHGERDDWTGDFDGHHGWASRLPDEM